MKYGTILYEVRDALRITTNEYLFLDAVMKLEKNERNPGWCDAGAAYLAWVVGISRRNIFPMYERLEKRGLLTLQPNGAHETLKKVAQLFADAVHKQDVSFLYDAFPTEKQAKSSGVTSPVMLHHHSDVTSPSVVMLHHQGSDVTSPASSDVTSPNKDINNTLIITVDNDVARARKTPPPTPPKTKKTETEKQTPTPPKPTQPAQPRALPWRSSPEFQGGADKFGQALRGRGILPENLDVEYYFGRGAEWSDNSTAKTGTAPVAADWLGKIHGWAVADMNAGKLRIIQQVQHTAYDGTTYTIPGNPTHTGNNAGRKPKYSNGRPDPAECAASARRVIARLTAEGYGT